MDVSIIIINYNTLEMTRKCIDSVLKKTEGISYEIILIDNASTDGSKVYFEKLNEKGILRYVYSYENMGFGRANNVGIMLSKGNYIFLLNSDTYLKNNAIKMFFDYAEMHNRCAFYGGWLENAKGDIIHSGGKMLSIKSDLHMATLAFTTRVPILKESRATIDNDAVMDERACQEVGYVTGADLFLHRSVIEKSGWFDHRFFMYCEESDWQKRAKNMNILSYIIHGPQIVHLQDYEKKPSLRGALMRFESKKLYFKKHCFKINYIIYRLIYFMLRFFPLLYNTNYTFAERLKLIGALAK